MKKDYKNHPFRVGDTVYHYSEGKGTINRVDENGILVKFENGEVVNMYKFGVYQLSFTPYEIPSNWERPPYEPKDGDIVKIVDFGGTEYEAIFKRRDSNNDIHTYVYSYIPCSDDGRAIDGGMFNSNAVITPSEGSDLFTKMERDGCRWNAEKKELEKIPEPLKAGDLVIAWKTDDAKNKAIITTLRRHEPKAMGFKYLVDGILWCINAVKFESMEQYEKIRRGEI